MRRMILVLTIAAVMALLMSLAASPALAIPFQANTGLCKAFAESGGHAPEPTFCVEPG